MRRKTLRKPCPWSALNFVAVLVVLWGAAAGGLHAGEVTVHGQVIYQDRLGGSHPVRFAMVEILDENGPGRSARVYRTSTDEAGHYEHTFDNLVDSDGSGADLRVLVWSRGVMSSYRGARSSICNVISAPLGLNYSVSSPRYPDNTLSRLEISFLVETARAGPWAVYDSVVEAFVKSVDLFGITNPALPGLVVWWPHDGGALYNVRGLHLPEDKKWQRDLIFHEYGHHIEAMVGFGDGDVGTNCHWRQCYDLREQPDCANPDALLRQGPLQAMNLAFREAWPTLFAIGSQLGETGYPGSGDVFYDDGDFRVSLEELTGLRVDSPGEFYECQTLGALWDIFDESDGGSDDADMISDDSPRFEKIWRVISRHRPDNIQEFWNGWVSEWGGHRDFARIFIDHGLENIVRSSDVVPNDACEGALELFLLPGGRVRELGDTALASPELTPCDSAPTARGTWYRFTGTGNRVRITTCDPGSLYDTRLVVFSGDCAEMVCVDSNDDDCGDDRLLSTLEVDTQAGGSYSILVSGFAEESGAYVLHLEDGAPDLPQESAGVGPFRRGDSNGDTRVDIADVSSTIGWLFLGGAEAPCRAAADANTDGLLNVADISWLLGWLFLGGPPPKAPVDCGPGRYSTDELLGCVEAGCQ